MDRSVDLVSAGEAGFSASQLARRMGSRIKEIRNAQGLSRRDFGAKLGVSGQQIHKYEIGQDTVPLHRLLALATICRVSPQTFWSQADAEPVVPDIFSTDDISTLQLLRAYRRIDDAKVRRSLLQFVKRMAGP